MVWHRVGSAAGRKACAGSSPALSVLFDWLKLSNRSLRPVKLSGSGLRAISNA